MSPCGLTKIAMLILPIFGIVFSILEFPKLGYKSFSIFVIIIPLQIYVVLSPYILYWIEHNVIHDKSKSTYEDLHTVIMIIIHVIVSIFSLFLFTVLF